MKLHPSSFTLQPSVSHVLAWAVACATFPLIWIGGFVTTYKAGMAVPDWPTTYGYNMFLYPLESWLKVFDVFWEHSHRLYAASVVGTLTIALAAAIWLGDRRAWLRWLGLIAVVLVSLQGVLGGLRVIADERLLAKIHGCTAPVFFALTASLVTFTSRAWRESRSVGPWRESRSVGARRESPSPLSRRGRGAGGEGTIALAVVAAIYLQIVAGAQLRHVVPQERTFWFAVWVWIHVIVAGLASGGVAWLAACAGRSCGRRPIVVRRARLLAGLMLVQLVLGAATWVTNYGWPRWFTQYVGTLEYTVVAGGPWQAVLTTAHVAVASLVLVTAISLALWSSRLPSDGDDRAHGFAVLGDYWRLTRPGIVAMVLVTMSVAALVAGPRGPRFFPLFHALAGAALVISGAIALNQRMEKTSDARMVRTALRPLPAGRLTSRQVTAFGIAASAAGMLYLVVLAPPMVSWLTAASWLVYVWMYTPLKGLSAWQTPLGAVAGAMPTLIGAAAAEVPPTRWMPLVLFGIVYFWQFPHAMAIAWLYRADFAAANVKVASVVDPSGRIAARLALIGAAALLPVSLAPCLDKRVGWGYAATALLLGLGYSGCAVAFCHRTVDARARAVLWSSLVYLPATCAALVGAVWR